MDYQKFKRIIAGLWVVAIAACIVKDVQEGKMKTLLVPVEVTDAQYLALDKVSKTDAHDEAQLVAAAAITTHANHALAEIERMTRDIHRTDEMLAASERAMPEPEENVQESEEVVREIKDDMPRTQGFVNAEVADVEAAALYEEIRAEENIGQLTASGGVFYGPSGKETWYNLPMENVISMMRQLGFTEDEYHFWIRDDGVKMFGRFVMVAADTNVRPKGTILDTSLGEGIVVDHCVRAESETGLIDIAVFW